MARSPLDNLRAATASDACDALGLPHQTLAPDWLSLQSAARVAGRAFVVRTEVSSAPADPAYAGLLAALDQLDHGDVWISSACGRRDVAVWGELLTMIALRRGAAGALCDGPVRDVAAIRRLGLPVFARGRCPADINGRLEVTGIGSTLTIDGVTISSGDLVVGDDDGIVIVPEQYADNVIAFAHRKDRAERLFADDIATGLSATAAFQRHQVL
jgi:4-hydroxy-4-methyl-2-oxoglutarate aldolase